MRYGCCGSQMPGEGMAICRIESVRAQYFAYAKAATIVECEQSPRSNPSNGFSRTVTPSNARDSRSFRSFVGRPGGRLGACSPDVRLAYDPYVPGRCRRSWRSETKSRADMRVSSQTVSCAGLVLHRVGILALDVNDIGSASRAKELGPKRNPAEDALAALGAMSSAVDTSMRTRTAHGVRIVAPHSGAVDEGALSRTVRKVLYRGDRHHGFGGHRLAAPIARVGSAVARRS